MYCEKCGMQLENGKTECPRCGAVKKENDGKGTFAAYEYKTIVAPKTMETVYEDCYRAFDWEEVNEVNAILSLDTVSLSFKRNRGAKGNVELARLQTQCDAALRNLHLIEAKKKSAGMIPALSVGVVSALILGGGMSLCLTTEYMIAGIIVGIVGLIGCAFPLFINRGIRDRKAESFATASDEQYDKIIQICEKAQLLLKQGRTI